MRTQLVMNERDERPALLSLTCWAVWLVVLPAILLSFLILADVPIFATATNVTVGLPLPIGLIPLLLVVAASVGIWRQEAWGVLLYGVAGLLGLLVMLFHPDAISMFAGQALPEALMWLIVGAAHIGYTWMLWMRVTAASA